MTKFIFLVRNYSKFCHALLDHWIMKNTVCSKTPSYCDAFSPVSSMYINKFHEISQRQSFFMEIILSPDHTLLDDSIMENPVCSKSPL